MPFICKTESMLGLASGISITFFSTCGCLYPGKPLYCLVGIIFLTTQYNAHIEARWMLWMDNVSLLLFWLNYEWHLTIPDPTEFCVCPCVTPALKVTSSICMTPLVLSFLSRCGLLTTGSNVIFVIFFYHISYRLLFSLLGRSLCFILRFLSLWILAFMFILNFTLTTAKIWLWYISIGKNISHP